MLTRRCFTIFDLLLLVAAGCTPDADTAYQRGQAYAIGDGVLKDDGEAAKWFRLAADQGLAVAQASLGAKFAMGQGLPKDYVLAYMWLNLAAAQPSDKHEEHTMAREGIEGLLTPAQLAEAQRLALEWKSRPER